MRTSLTLLLIFSGFAAAAQYELSGKVYDNSGAPLFGVKVELLNKSLSTFTKPDGTWQLTGVADSDSLNAADTLSYVWKENTVERIFLPSHFQSGMTEIVNNGSHASTPQEGASQERMSSSGKLACADISVPQQEQGKYARQSITHLDDLLLRGNAYSLQQDQIGYIRGLLPAFRLPRFDDNPLPNRIVHRFSKMIQQEELSNDEIAELIDEKLLPGIKEEVEKNGLARAADLRSDLQKNSSMNDKMKTLDITGQQLLSVMNAAWVYVPVIDTFVTATDYRSGMVSAAIDMSVLWYHMECDSSDGKIHAKFVQEVKGDGSMAADPRSGINAFQSAAKTCVRNLLTATKEMPNFNVSGQVLESGKHAVRIDIGKNQGISRNDQYVFVESFQDSSGLTKNKDVGWARVYSRDDSDAKARIVSGNPYPGLMLREAALSSFSLEFGFYNEPVTIDGTGGCREIYSYNYTDYEYQTRKECSDPKSYSLTGLQIGAYNSLSWWYGLSLGMGLGFMNGDGFDLDWKILSLRQSIPVYRNFSVYAEPQIVYRITSDFAIQYWTALGLEIALAPNWNLRLGSSVAHNNIVGDMQNDGATFSFAFQWTPRALSVDPFDLITSTMWSVSNSMSQSQQQRR